MIKKTNTVRMVEESNNREARLERLSIIGQGETKSAKKRERDKAMATE